MSLPSKTLTRARIPLNVTCQSQQTRHATLLHRPQTPYSFTQLVTLSDGSTYLSRTTSPAPIYRSTKDTRNHLKWQPSLSSLKNVEQDEAGRLRAFRNKFGRGWDLDAATEEGNSASKSGQQSGDDDLMDLISGSAGVPQQVKATSEGNVAKEVKMVTVKVDGVLKKVADNRSASRKG